MAFWINIHGCQPYPRNSHLCTKSAQKPKLLLATVDGSQTVNFVNVKIRNFNIRKRLKSCQRSFLSP